MALGYCTGCQTEVTVRQGACLLGHAVDSSRIVERRGRHAANPPQTTRRPLTRPATRGIHHPLRRSPSEEGGDSKRPALAVLDLLGFSAGEEAPISVQPAPIAKPVPVRPPLSSVRQDPADDTPTLIARLLSTTPAEEPPAWRPPAFLSLPGRQFRWTILAVAGGMALLILVGGLTLIRRPSALEAKLMADHRDRAAALASVLPEVEVAARNLDDPASVAASTAALAELDETARDLFEVAAAGDPPNLIGASSTTLARLQKRAGDVAAHAMQLEQVLGDALAYQLSLGTLLVAPNLPATAQPTAVADLAGRLSVWAASISRFDQAAPDAPQFSGSRTSVAAWSDWLVDWQADYLDALRAGDQPRAERLRTDLQAAVAEVENAAGADLISVQDWATATIEELRTDLEALAASI